MATELELKSHLRLNTEVTAAKWDEHSNMWRIDTGQGRRFDANVLIVATGVLHVPKIVRFQGDEKFEGKIIHCAQWNEKIDLRDKRVGVIGTGASAVQIVPAITDHLQKLVVFQRTPTWVIPRDNRRFPSAVKTLFCLFPWTRQVLRCLYFLYNEMLFELLFKLDGPREFPCPITHFTKNGVVARSEYELDVVILATGFDVVQSCHPFPITGLESQTLTEQWGDYPRAFKACTMPNFPNLFHILGPGAGLGHSSVLFVAECQVTYLVDAIRNLANLPKGSALNLRKDKALEYEKWAEKEMEKCTFQHKSCTSWYRNERGINWTLWPKGLIHYWWTTFKLQLSDYEIIEAKGN